MDVLGRCVVQINIVNACAVAHIVRHARRCDNIVELQRGVCRKLRRAARLSGERMTGRSGAARGIDLPHRLHNLEEAGAARNAVGLERRRHCETDCLFGAGRVRHDEIRRHRVKTPLHTFHRGIKRLEIDGKICPFSHGAPPFRLIHLYYISLLSEFQALFADKAPVWFGTIPGLRYPGEKGGSEEEKEEKDTIKARETIGRSGG